MHFLQEGVEGGSWPDDDAAAIKGEAHDRVPAEPELLPNPGREVDTVPVIDRHHERGAACAADDPELPPPRSESPDQHAVTELAGLWQVDSEPLVDPADRVVPDRLEAGARGRERCEVKTRNPRPDGLSRRRRRTRFSAEPQSGYLNTGSVGFFPLSGGRGGVMVQDMCNG